MGPIFIVAAVVVGLVLLMSILRWLTRAIIGRATKLAHSRYRPEEMRLLEPMASTFGIESKGGLQGRGNGALVLTDDAIHFLMLVGSELRIPLANVLAVKTVKSHLGKSIARPLLHVRYREGDGEDAVAWFVPDVEDWKQRIEASRKG